MFVAELADVLRLNAYGDEWLTNQIFWRGFDVYEAESMSVFLRLAATAKTIVDIGAHIGIYSLGRAKFHPGRDRRVPAMPSVYERLVENVELNGLANVNVRRGGSRRPMWHRSFLPCADQRHPSSLSLSLDFMEQYEELGFSSVAVVTLDDYCAQKKRLRWTWSRSIGTTTEPAVIRGMRDILDRDRPSILRQVLPGFGVEPELESVLGPLDYVYYVLTIAGQSGRTRSSRTPTGTTIYSRPDSLA